MSFILKTYYMIYNSCLLYFLVLCFNKTLLKGIISTQNISPVICLIIKNPAGLTGAVAVIASLSSVRFLAVPDSLCIIFACPVVTIVLSAVLLRDKINLVKVSPVTSSSAQC